MGGVAVGGAGRSGEERGRSEATCLQLSHKHTHKQTHTHTTLARYVNKYICMCSLINADNCA